MAVIQVDDKEFNSQIKDNQRVVVKYFANWCGSCKLFAPKYKRVSNEDENDGVIFLEVNAEENPEARKKAQVDNLPFLAAFKNGELVDGSASNKEEYLRDLIAKVS